MWATINQQGVVRCRLHAVVSWRDTLHSCLPSLPVEAFHSDSAPAGTTVTLAGTLTSEKFTPPSSQRSRRTAYPGLLRMISRASAAGLLNAACRQRGPIY